MNKVIHFEIPVDHVMRAQSFYRDVFGWKVNPVPDMDYTIVVTGPTDDQNMPEEAGFISGGLMKRSGEFKHPDIVIEVDDIEETLKEVVTKGGQIVRTKMEVGNMGYAAYFRDPEDNLIGIWQNRKKT
jgi:predicted enzyme related to lactoylglutathione lyase